MIRLTQAMSSGKPGVAEVAEAEIQTRAQPGRSDPADDWLCAWCLNRVASEKDRFFHNGRKEFSFRNPEGIRFNIFTFTRTLGCQPSGVPTLEHTWFPGYAWSGCLCDRCRTHLGWFYTGPTEFVGLIRDRIVRASLVMS